MDTESTLHVHHERYIPGAEPWDHPLEILTTLCESCHKGESERRIRMGAELSKAAQATLDSYEIQNLAGGIADAKMPSDTLERSTLICAVMCAFSQKDFQEIVWRLWDARTDLKPRDEQAEEIKALIDAFLEVG